MEPIDHPLLRVLAILPQLSRRGRRILHATLSEIEPNGSDKAASRLSEPATPPKPPKPARPDKADEWAPLLTELKAHLASGLVSQTELAAAVEIGRTSLRDWLAGRRVPSPAARRKLRAWLAAHPLEIGKSGNSADPAAATKP